MVILDPMHNLFLGCAKYVTKRLFLDRNIITEAHLKSIQEYVDLVRVPIDCGRIPHKVSSGVSGFIANQYKNWVNLYSIPSLNGKVSDQYLECWRSFVLSCRILCKPSFSTADVNLADLLLMQFCSKIEQICGKDLITPNMHMHGHLKAVIEDFGPLHSFWLFAYERFNGILGSYPNNNKSIEPQLTKRFLQTPPSEYYVFQKLMPIDVSNNNGDTVETVKLHCRHTVGTFVDWEIASLTTILTKTHQSESGAPSKKFATIQWHCKQLSSLLNKSSHNNILIAEWDKDIYGEPPTQLPGPHHPCEHQRPIQVH